MRLTSPAILRGAAALAGVLGCGPTVSLDDPTAATGSSGTSTGAGPFGPLSSSVDATLVTLDDGPRLDVQEPRLDIGPDVPLPPGSCPPDCVLELGLGWTYDGFSDGSPLDPEDRVALLVEPLGTIVVAEERQGALELARLSLEGQELWTMPLALPCDPCRLVDLSLHPSGDLLLAGHGLDAEGTPVALAARVELGGPELVWASALPLAIGDGIAPRAGSLVVHEDALLLQPVIQASPRDGSERLELFAYDGTGGGLVLSTTIATGFASGDAPPPLAIRDATDALVVTHPAWTGTRFLSGTVSWLAPPNGELLATSSRVEPSLRLAADMYGRAFTVGQTAGDGQSLLYIESGEVTRPEAWQIVRVLRTVTSSAPALAVDGYGHLHVLARTASGRPGQEEDVELEVLRWAGYGELVWVHSLPLALDRVDQPVAVAIGPGDELLVAGFVAGARHVEQRLPSCDCD